MNPIDRRNLLQTLAGGVLLGSAIPAAQIPDEVVTKDKAKVSPQPFGDHRVYLDGNTDQLKGLTVGSIELKAGQEPHPPHSHPEEEILLVSDGHGEISIGDKVTKVGPGAVLYVGANHVHGIVNTSKALLTFYYFKWLGT